MSSLLALRIVTYLLVGVGVAALLLAGLLDPLGGLILSLALVGSWAIDHVRERVPVRAIFGWALVTTAAFAIGIDLLYLAQNLLDGMVHLLLFLILLRLFRRRSLKDLRDAGFLSFFMLVAASAVTFNVSFLFVFVAFLVLGTWMLILHHLVGETERAKTGAAELAAGGFGPRSPLFRMSLVAAAGTFVLAGVMFFVIPRVGQATLPFRAELGRRLAGFSERVELGAYGEIEADQTVVMRVRFPDSIEEPQLLPNLRWRGLALDRFDGRVWEASPQRRLLRRETSGEFQLAAPRGAGPVVWQEILLDPIGSDAVFAAPRALRIDIGPGAVGLDDMGGIVLPAASTRLQYRVESELESTPPRGLRPAAWPVDAATAAPARFLQLPPMSERIRALAREVTAGSRQPYEAAIKLTHYLSSERFTYTLVLKRETQLEPLEEFLFVRRSGNCEYFAASLAVMLRSVGIPARVVGGFQRGEWNPYGRYFTVRMKDAHSWVEAHFDGAGWVTLDPSPRAAVEEAGGPSTWALYVDAVRMRWYRYVVNWSLRDQVSVAASMHRGAVGWRTGLVSWRDWARGLPPAAAASAAGAIVVAMWLLRRRAPGASGRVAPPAVPRFYLQALRLLARRGVRRAPAETAREFAQRVEAQAPGVAAALVRLTAVYERCRFGAGALTAEETAAVEASLTALRGR